MPPLQRAAHWAVGTKFAEKLHDDAALQLGEVTLRGSEADCALQQLGSTFTAASPDPTQLQAHSGARAESLYDLSADVREIDHFVSHSWRDPRVLKFLTLAIYFRGWAATWLALALSLAIGAPLQHVLARRGLLAGVRYDSDWPVNTGGIIHVLWGTLFVLFLCVGVPKSLRGGELFCFVDRLCIHQTDHTLMRKGIAKLGAFLSHSRRMLVCYSSNYVSRLWCMFELAAKCHTHGAESIDLVPIVLGVTLASPCAFCYWGSLLVAFGGASCPCSSGVVPFDQVLASSPIAAGIALVLGVAQGAGLIHSISAWQAAIRQTIEELQRFEVAALGCSQDADRAFVEGCITRWYGSISSFEATVASRIRRSCSHNDSLEVPCRVRLSPATNSRTGTVTVLQ